MSEQHSTHAEEALPTPHISEVTEATQTPVEVKTHHLNLMNAEAAALKQGEDPRNLPLASMAITSAENARKATTDQLTGLLNREGMKLWFERYKPDKYGIIFADAVGFKSINDEFGEDFGDGVLSYIGKSFAGKLRLKKEEVPHEQRLNTDAQDAMGVESGVSRWGGDEFVIVVDLTGVEDDQTSAVMDSIGDRLQAFDDYSPDNDPTVQIPIQIRSVYETARATDGVSFEEHLAHLDEDLYALKRTENT